MTLLLESALRAWFIITFSGVLAVLLRAASADVRRRVWITGMCACACLPLAALSAPVHSRMFGAFLISRVAYAPGDGVVESAASSKGASWVVVLWAAGAAIVLARLAAGIWKIHRLTRRANVDQRVSYSSEIDTPLTWGFVHPTILLPDFIREWPAEKRDLVLRHEEAHIRQHDWMWQIAARLICAAYWFNPLVWIAAGEMAREMENAADDCVIAAGIDGAAYAGGLLEIARRMKGISVAGGVAMVGRRSLETRVRSILDVSRRRRPAGRVVAVVLAALAAIAVVGVSAPIAGAQTTRAYHVGDEGVMPPRPLTTVKANYTPDAMQRKIQGDVILTAEVTEQGGIEKIAVKDSLDPDLDTNAVEALAQWTFAPGTKDGQPVRVAVTVDVRFTLR